MNKGKKSKENKTDMEILNKSSRLLAALELSAAKGDKSNNLSDCLTPKGSFTQKLSQMSKSVATIKNTA